MSDIVEIGLKAAAVGIGGTLALDLWAFLLQRVFHTPATNWAMVGRWIGHMPKGQFVQKNISAATPVLGESLIGCSRALVEQATSAMDEAAASVVVRTRCSVSK